MCGVDSLQELREMARPQRPRLRHDVGMYHKTDLVDPIEIVPRGFVKALPAFAVLAPLVNAGDIDSAAEAAVDLTEHLTEQEVEVVRKVWTELAYELARVTNYAGEVSRLDCVFLFENPVDAFESLGTWGSSQWVWRCEIPGDSPVSRCDVDHFFVRNLDKTNPEAWRNKWERSLEESSGYWAPGDNPTAEILVAGSARLLERVHLRDFV